MRAAHATGICATHMRAADARTYGRTYVDNYSPCEDILLLSNAHEQNAISALIHHCRGCAADSKAAG